MKRDLLKAATSFSKAGFKIFKCTGKRPAVQWKTHPHLKPEELEGYLKDWTGNYGVAPTAHQLVVDIDPRNFDLDDLPHKRLFNACRVKAKGLTTTVATGGGGLHMYFTLPTLPEGMKVRKHHPDYKGIDFISDGAYVIGPGSLHPTTNEYYELLENYPEPIHMIEAPQELIDIICAEKVVTIVEDDIDSTKEDDIQAIARYTEFLLKANPAISGANGDAHTFAMACKGRDFGLSATKTLDLMLTEWNERCTPEWDVEDLTKKVKNAYEFAQGAVGSAHPATDFSPIAGTAEDPQEKHAYWRGWDRKENGKLESTLNNCVNFFCNHHLDPDNPLLDSLVYDSFSNEIMKTKWMPWDDVGGKKFPSDGVVWTDSDSAKMKFYLSSQKKYNTAKETIEDALVNASEWKTIHPIKEYLTNLIWDGKPRLETFIVNNTGAEDTALNREYSRVMIMQAVNRIFDPGCQADIVVILEGDQGIGKSRLVRMLGGKYYANPNIVPGDKDTIAAITGNWIIEMSEMAVFKKKDADDLKDFISNTIDRFRPAYARRARDFPRQSIFIGTFNPDATGEYLTDPTGNRRYAPINLGSKPVQELKIKAIRDQIFAEATHRLLSGELCYINDKKLLNLHNAEGKKRMTSDTWEDPILNYINKHEPYTVSVNDIWNKALGGNWDDVKNLTIIKRRRIANTLRKFGYTSYTMRDGHSSRSVFRNREFERSGKTKGLDDE